MNNLNGKKLGSGKKPCAGGIRHAYRGARDEARPPVIRLRMVFVGLCVLIVGMAGPLALVWKQSYINQVSIRLENRADTLRILNGQATSLKLEGGRLSAPERIERLAASRGFGYPSSNSMEVLAVGATRQRNDKGIGGFLARVKQAVLGDRG